MSKGGIKFEVFPEVDKTSENIGVTIRGKILVTDCVLPASYLYIT